jgi:predicted membrane-bound spermidine synthase
MGKKKKSGLYWGLFFVTFSTLMFEIILTKLFSVVLGYHFAFFIISIALFGLSVGSIVVYYFSDYFSKKNLFKNLTQYSFYYSLSIVFSVIIFLILNNFDFSRYGLEGLILLIAFLLMSIPFTLSGICIALCLTKRGKNIGKTYAYDLLGSSLGCLLLPVLINFVANGISVVFIIAFLALLSSYSFNKFIKNKKRQTAIKGFGLIFLLIGLISTFFAYQQKNLFKLGFVKGEKEDNILFEKWNSLSRIRVSGNGKIKKEPFGWGLSPRFDSKEKINQLFLDIDSDAGTPLTKFDGNLDKLEFLKYDVVNMPHYLRSNADVLIIGSGGGRDVLSALVFKQKTITGIEINKTINFVVNGYFGDFTGHLDEIDNVKFINAEARSYLQNDFKKYDIIQIPLIDTWASSSNGSFVLSENTLYTLEGWEVFLERLNQDGILTVSRWYSDNYPAEVYRLTSLAVHSLKKIGIEDPQDNIMIVKSGNIGTLMISKVPFSKNDIAILNKISKEKAYQIIVSPNSYFNDDFEKIVKMENIDQFPMNLSPPTDNQPFFFHSFSIKNLLSNDLKLGISMVDNGVNNVAVIILINLLTIVTFGTIFFIILPLIFKSRKTVFPKDIYKYLFYFACIGLGFMFIEISQIQKLSIFLGHPTYGLSIVLFVILLTSGIGSYYSKRLIGKNIKLYKKYFLSFLILILIYGFVLDPLFSKLQNETMFIKIPTVIMFLSPLGFLMGLPFPMGMTMVTRKNKKFTPWFWGINGATSVFASVFSVFISLEWGIKSAYWVGGFFYLIVFIVLLNFKKNKKF